MKTNLGINQNLEAALCYFLGWISGIIILLVEKENKFIRFHALQSVVVFVGLWITAIVIGWIPIINILYFLLIIPVSIILWVLLIIKALQGQKYKLPYIGNFVEEQLMK